MTPEDLAKKHVKDIFDMYKDDDLAMINGEDGDEDEEDESSDDENLIKDDFLDMPVNGNL